VRNDVPFRDGGAYGVYCSLQDALDVDSATPSERDCGNAGAGAFSGPTPEQFRAVHDCIAGSIAMNQTFVAARTLQGIDSHSTTLFRGFSTDAGISVRQYSEQFCGCGVPQTSEVLSRDCAGFVDEGACSNPEVTFCFECAGWCEATESVRCRR